MPRTNSRPPVTRDMCGACDFKVEDDDAAVLCDGCNQWEHLRCSAMDKETYEWLKEHPTPHLVFICTACLKLRRKRKRTSRKLQRSVSDTADNADRSTAPETHARCVTEPEPNADLS